MRVELKASGVKQAMNMKEATILKKYSELTIDRSEDATLIGLDADKADIRPSFEVNITKADEKLFKTIGFKAEWLASIANQYDFNRFVYIDKFKAFRCYQGNNHLDWIAINDLSMINIKKEITHSYLNPQPLQKDKMIIKLPWRK